MPEIPTGGGEEGSWFKTSPGKGSTIPYGKQTNNKRTADMVEVVECLQCEALSSTTSTTKKKKEKK
jgi:hypothetical protein